MIAEFNDAQHARRAHGKRQSMLSRFAVCLVLTITIPERSYGSWLSEITGIHINVHKREVYFSAPNPAAIPDMLANLPKDTAQFVMNPKGNYLAAAIRENRERAKASCQPVPNDIRSVLSRFFPPQVFGVCYSVASRSRINMDTILLKHGSMAAVALYDVIVFRDDSWASDPVLWAHELTHIIQYHRLGLETFAHLYTVNFVTLESEAKDMEAFVKGQLDSDVQRMWYTNPGYQYSLALNSTFMLQHAPQFDPKLCSQFFVRGGFTELYNNCPVAIKAVNFRIRNMYTGQIWNDICDASPCIVMPGAAYRWPENFNPGWATVWVDIAWAQ